MLLSDPQLCIPLWLWETVMEEQEYLVGWLAEGYVRLPRPRVD